MRVSVRCVSESSSVSILFKDLIVYLRERKIEIFLLLVPFSHSHNSQDLGQDKPGAQTRYKSPTWVVGAQVLEPIPAAFSRTLVGSWIRSRTARYSAMESESSNP